MGVISTLERYKELKLQFEDTQDDLFDELLAYFKNPKTLWIDHITNESVTRSDRFYIERVDEDNYGDYAVVMVHKPFVNNFYYVARTIRII